jgi:ferredoxin
MKDKNVKIRKVPVIDLSRCTDCESCLETCPAIFKRNEETGVIEIVDLSEYPEEDVHEAMSVCPTDCITWEENPSSRKYRDHENGSTQGA